MVEFDIRVVSKSRGPVGSMPSFLLKKSSGSSGLRNNSNIFPEMRKPPAILMKERLVAMAPKKCPGESGIML